MICPEYYIILTNLCIIELAPGLYAFIYGGVKGVPYRCYMLVAIVAIVAFCLWCGKVVPKLFVCIVQLLVIP